MKEDRLQLTTVKQWLLGGKSQNISIKYWMSDGSTYYKYCLAAMSKSMLVGRLREAEDQLLSTRQEETMSTLVQTKIKLAQADYVNLELQVQL